MRKEGPLAPQNFKAFHTWRGVVKGLFAATCCSHEIMCSSHKGALHPCNNLSLRHVLWSSISWTLCNTVAGTKYPKDFVLQELKIIRAQWDMLEGHVPTTFLCVCNLTLSVPNVPATHPCYISPMWEHKILCQQHVAATCPCISTPHAQIEFFKRYTNKKTLGLP